MPEDTIKDEEYAPITQELREYIERHPTMMHAVGLADLCDNIDAVHRSLEAENESLHERLQELDNADGSMQIGEVTVTITPRIDWTAIADNLRDAAKALCERTREGGVMSATDDLRRLLEERGVEWDYGITGATTTRFSVNGIDLTFTPMRDGLVCSTILTPEQAIAATLGPVITGDTSDGYHTFNELYHHRAVLFSVIVRDHADLAWKSKLHHDGTMYDGMFIVGIETPQGQATYHYDIDPYWEMFYCKELERAPEWDGHTPSDAIARIATLGRRTCYPVPVYGFDGEFTEYDYDECSVCGTEWDGDTPNFCPWCGAKVVNE